LADRLDCLYDKNCCHKKMTWTEIRQSVEVEANVSFSPHLVLAYQSISAEIESLFNQVDKT